MLGIINKNNKKEKNVMKIFKTGIVVNILCGLALATSAIGADVTLKILAPWQGKGQVFKIAPNKVKVVGSFDGIMYIDQGRGELDAAVFMCPGTEYINLDTKRATIEADCMISKGKNKVAYARLTAKGELGALDGDFVIVGGERQWKGMSGKGKVTIRTALGTTALNKKTGELINSAAGLAVWPALKISKPGR